VKIHPAADLFPPMSEDEFQALKADIAANGLREPVWIILDDAPEHHKCYGDDDSRCDLVYGDGVWTCRTCDYNPAPLEYSIIDGRHRWRACSELGIECETMEYTDDDPLGFVVSLNLHRRHLNESQRAMVAAKMATLRQGDNSNAPIGALAQSQAADLLNVSRRAVQRAAVVRDEATPELARAVESGRVSVSAAADVATLSMEEQAEIVAKGDREILQAAKLIRAHVANNNGNNEWYTPPVFIAAAREVMGSIDIDPASSEVANRTVGASTYYTEQSNGLAHEWKGCVWMNPPYAQPLIAEFCDRLVAQVKAGNTLQACVLVNNATETTWFQSLLGVATAVCFTRGRVRFLDPDGNPGAPLQGQAVLYVGSSVQRFRERFAELGKVLIA
jgi:hypothetical protein